jgi:hypothetical protein
MSERSELQEKIKQLSIMTPGTVSHISTPTAEGYICRGTGDYSVAIPYDFDKPFYKTFVGITIRTSFLNLVDKSIKVLYLNAKLTVDLSKFSYICTQFLDLEERKAILSDPAQWADDWNEIFGNSVRKMMVFDVVGELVAFKHIFSLDKTAKWEGPNDDSQDIVAKDYLAEVKTTTLKSDYSVHINSAFQLAEGKKEKLFFCRLEKKPYGITIDSLVHDLVLGGYNENELNDSLGKLGYNIGCEERTVGYDLLALYSFDVDRSSFPLISLDELNNLAPKKNIVGFSLMLDLSSLQKNTIFEKNK